MKLDIRTLSASLVAGFVSWYLCAGIYNKNADSMWTPLLMALLFLVLAAITCLVVRLTTGRRTRFMQFKGIGQIMTMLAVGLVALMVLAGLFELLLKSAAGEIPFSPLRPGICFIIARLWAPDGFLAWCGSFS